MLLVRPFLDIVYVSVGSYTDLDYESDEGKGGRVRIGGPASGFFA
jgi:hypothetical protein